MKNHRITKGWAIAALASISLALGVEGGSAAAAPASPTNGVTEAAPPAAAPAAPTKPPAPPPTGAAAPTAAAAVSCEDALPKNLPPGNTKLTVTIDPTTVWQPRGGEIKFTIKGPGFSPDGMDMVACFRWRNDAADAKNHWVQSPTVRLVDNTTVGATSFIATVPTELPREPVGFFDRFLGRADRGEYKALDLVPLADFRVLVKSPGSASWSPLDVVQPVGVTQTLVAMLVAVVLLVLGWVFLYLCAKARQVPGAGDPVLQIISTKAGYASLSQLQILLWAFVIGASAIYVMALSGNLIEITSGTLVLLGISAAATMGAKLQSNAADTPKATTPSPPGAVVGLQAFGPPGESEIDLIWTAPTTGGAPDTYLVQYRATNLNPLGDWQTATSTLTRPGFKVTGLIQNTLYAFQVIGQNQGGPGAPPPTPVNASTIQTPAGAIAAVTNLRLSGPVTNSAIGVTFGAVPTAAAYQLRYRRHDSAEGWQIQVPVNQTAILRNLTANTVYDISVAAAAAPQGNAAPVYANWVTTQVKTSGPRVPKWSDLIVDGDSVTEVNVTRVQMLFFTVAVALFVVLRVLVSGAIPDIPDNYLVLMGISNGVYLTAKWVPG